MKVLLVLVAALFAGCTSWRVQTVPVGDLYLQRCDGCHDGSAAPDLFSRRWRQSVEASPFGREAAITTDRSAERMARLIAETIAIPEWLSAGEVRELRAVIVCFHFPTSRSCRS